MYLTFILDSTQYRRYLDFPSGGNFINHRQSAGTRNPRRILAQVRFEPVPASCRQMVVQLLYMSIEPLTIDPVIDVEVTHTRMSSRTG